MKQLPERPDFGHLKCQAKDLLKAIRAGDPEALSRVVDGTDPKTFALHDAQRVVAREYGAASWAKLKAQIAARSADDAESQLIGASLGGDHPSIERLLKENPALQNRSICTAAVLGDGSGIKEWIAREPTLATTQAGPRDWPPLLYLSFGRGGQGDAARAAAATTLLAAGADPNTSWIDPSWPESPQPALYGATGVNNYPQLARVLLAAGADPNDSESRYHAAEYNHVACLEALRQFGANFSGQDKIWGNTPLGFLLAWGHPQSAVQDGIAWLLEKGQADPNVPSYAKTTNETALHLAVRKGWERSMIDLLLRHRADPLRPRGDGRTPFDLAVQGARDDVVALFRECGVTVEPNFTDQFLGQCMAGNLTKARELLARRPNLVADLSAEERQRVFDAARAGQARALTVMGELGFDLTIKEGESEATALHWASYHGRADAVRALIAQGVPLDPCDARFHAPPVGWCAHGSIYCCDPDGDYPASMQALIEGGAKVPKGTLGNPQVMGVISAATGNPHPEDA